MAVVLFTLPLIGDVTLGAAISVFGTIASMLLNHPKQQQPQFKSMGSAWGTTWPIVFNQFRLGTQIIQAGPVTKHSVKKSKKGQPTYSQTFAAGVCEGPCNLGRIWFDNKVVYDPRPISTPPTWTANTAINSGDQIQPTGGGSWVLTATTTGTTGVTEPSWNLAVDASTKDNDVLWVAAQYVPRTFVGKQYDFSMRVYNGTEEQLADAALEELVGTGNQSAYRGLFYLVFEDFDLSKWGNRVPNIEVEVLPPPRVPYQFSQDPKWSYSAFRQMMADPNGNYAYFWGEQGTNPGVNPTTWKIIKVDLNNGAVTAKSAFVSKANNWPSIEEGPPQASLTGTKVWYWTYNAAASQQALVSHDADTLALVDYYTFTFAYSPLGQTSVNGPGDMAALFDAGTDLLLMNLTSGAFVIKNLTTVGFSGLTNLWTPTFDDAGHIWLYDDEGNFWRFNVSQVGAAAPTITGGISINARPNDGAGFASLAFNSDTGIMTAFSPTTLDMWAVPIDVATSIVGTPVLLADCAVNSYGCGDLFGWHRGRFLAMTPQHSGVPNFPALYDTQAGTLVEYDWPYWGETNPGAAVEFISAAANFTGSYITSLNADLILAPDVPDPNYYDCWFFPIVSPDAMTLADICANISDRVGITSGQRNFAALSTVIPRGCAVLNRSKAREFLEALMPAFYFDMTDIGASIVGTLRSAATISVTIPEANLGATADVQNIVDRIFSTRGADLEIPRDLAISYYDLNHDYQMGSQPDQRSEVTQYSSGSNTLSVPVVMTPQEAANAAMRLLYLTWIERTPRKLSLPLQYIGITPADVIAATRGTELYNIRVSKARFTPEQIIEIEGVSEDLGVYSLVAAAALASLTTGSFIPGTVKPIVGPVLAVMDTAMLRDVDTNPGVYVAGCPSKYAGGWDGLSVQASPDGSIYTEQCTIITQSAIGTADGVLADCLAWQVWDRTNYIDVKMIDGVLASASEADLLSSFLNLFWSESGEVFQAATVTLLTGTTYRLTDLLRGRFGTESFTGSHFDGEQIVMIDNQTGNTSEYSASRIGQAIYWKGVNDAQTNPETDPQLLTMTTRRLLPYAPYFIRGSRDLSGNLTITGLNRQRWRGRPLWTPPEMDAPATMEIDIMNGITVVRTLTATLSGGGSGIIDPSSFGAYYSAADQTADFGSPQASVTLKPYKINALVGRGYTKEATV